MTKKMRNHWISSILLSIGLGLFSFFCMAARERDAEGLVIAGFSVALVLSTAWLVRPTPSNISPRRHSA